MANNFPKNLVAIYFLGILQKSVGSAAEYVYIF